MLDANLVAGKPFNGKIVVIDECTTEERESGVVSTVFRACLIGEPERLISIKSTPAKRIIKVVGSSRSGAAIELYTLWIPHSLEELLDMPTFSPSPIPSQAKHLLRKLRLSEEQPSREEIFQLITKSIVYQVIRALEYLHGWEEPVGHRDVKPRNGRGCVKLVDLDIAYQESTSADAGNLWPETKENKYNDVATGPFRAPELLFGPKTYDTCATDLWSLGCTIAPFFTPIWLHRKTYYDDEEDEDEGRRSDEDDKPSATYVLPENVDAITFPSLE